MFLISITTIEVKKINGYKTKFKVENYYPQNFENLILIDYKIT
jgi:hypothetical protein